MSIIKNRSDAKGIQIVLLIPILLCLWFAWSGFSGMLSADPFSWEWLARLMGGVASLVIISAAAYGIYLNRAKKIRFNSKS